MREHSTYFKTIPKSPISSSTCLIWMNDKLLELTENLTKITSKNSQTNEQMKFQNNEEHRKLSLVTGKFSSSYRGKTKVLISCSISPNIILKC